MGTGIDRDAFTDGDYARFRERLEGCLSVLAELLDQPGFGTGPATVGAELELFLVDRAGRPLPRNREIRAAVADPRITFELGQFNLEVNSSPVPLAGRPFTALGDEMTWLLDRTAEQAADHRGRVALIGILPTLRLGDLRAGMMTDVPRYHALNQGLQRIRRDPVHIRIAGADPLELASQDITFGGANTSFQVHLRVDPADFTRTYNAVQLATAPALAVAGNSPTFLGHRLWEETRIALFKQAIDDRTRLEPRRRPGRATLGTGWLRGGALDLFAESVRLHRPLLPVLDEHAPPAGPPSLGELRLHQGTVWPWNRAIYDPASGGHLRIEMRALPAGPTVTDMLANAAFLIGLSLWLARQDQQWTYELPFERADHGFYRAAQHGLEAELSWPSRPGGRIRTVRAGDLVAELVPRARQGLLLAGLDCAETHNLLDVIAARAASGQTGSAWQRAALAAAGRALDRERALAVMLDQYLARSATGQPVHAWPPGR
ncbi:MAG TPA: glutamate--cysteine ligase [Streptosporangiaceae bacterium]|nr:glutamate--cysteine ligase [Streptosporangiaceae bacterium]